MSKLLINFFTKKTVPDIARRFNDLPEQILRRLVYSGEKSILLVKMNECKSAIIKKGQVTTIFTDMLTGCNSVCIIAKDTAGNPIAIMTHAMPTEKSIATQCNNIDVELERYKSILDKRTIPNVYFNVNERNLDNPIFTSVRNVLNRHFGRNFKETVVKYQPVKNHSTANIYEFYPNNLNQVKITYVGQKSSTEALT